DVVREPVSRILIGIPDPLVSDLARRFHRRGDQHKNCDTAKSGLDTVTPELHCDSPRLERTLRLLEAERSGHCHSRSPCNDWLHSDMSPGCFGRTIEESHAHFNKLSLQGPAGKGFSLSGAGPREA